MAPNVVPRRTHLHVRRLAELREEAAEAGQGQAERGRVEELVGLRGEHAAHLCRVDAAKNSLALRVVRSAPFHDFRDTRVVLVRGRRRRVRVVLEKTIHVHAAKELLKYLADVSCYFNLTTFPHRYQH